MGERIAPGSRAADYAALFRLTSWNRPSCSRDRLRMPEGRCGRGRLRVAAGRQHPYRACASWRDVHFGVQPAEPVFRWDEVFYGGGGSQVGRRAQSRSVLRRAGNGGELLSYNPQIAFRPSESESGRHRNLRTFKSRATAESANAACSISSR